MVKSSTDSFGFDSDKHYFQAVIPGWSLDNWPPFDRAGKAPDFFADAAFYIDSPAVLVRIQLYFGFNKSKI